jgi:hypothetical protein
MYKSSVFQEILWYLPYPELTPWIRALPEKPIVPWLVKNLPTVYGNTKFMTPEPDQSSPCLPIPLLDGPF